MNFHIGDIEQLDWNKQNGLLPAIVQDARSGAVLMLGYMNREALCATLERLRVVFYSRSRQRLWEKGEFSGHSLSLVGITKDCDDDTLLVTAVPNGPVCHTGTETCFGDELRFATSLNSAPRNLAFLATLEEVIDERIANGDEASYIHSLHAKGIKRMAQKVGEEGLEVALSAVSDTDEALIGEAADLILHLLLLLRGRDLSLQWVVDELSSRHLARTQAAI